jgi:hypothetical protein
MNEIESPRLISRDRSVLNIPRCSPKWAIENVNVGRAARHGEMICAAKLIILYVILSPLGVFV